MTRWNCMTFVCCVAALLVGARSAQAQVEHGPDTIDYRNPPRDYVTQRVDDLDVSIEKQLYMKIQDSHDVLWHA